MDAVGDDFHRRCCRVAQAGVTGDLTADAFALVAHHVAHVFQRSNDPVDFLDRIAGDAPDYSIQIFGRRAIGRGSLAPLLAQERDAFDITSFFRWTPFGRSECLRAGFLCHGPTPTQAQPLRDKLASSFFVEAIPSGGFILDVSQSVCGASSSSLSLAVSIVMRISASVRVRFGLNASSS